MHHSSTRQSASVLFWFFFHLCLHTYIHTLHMHATFYSGSHLENCLEQKFKSVQDHAATLMLEEFRFGSDIHTLHLFMCFMLLNVLLTQFNSAEQLMLFALVFQKITIEEG